ncbi:hypothetical protein A3J90_04095 [candidate division WOR-1 bacterium RIFOXYC2_FULL_37_10]|uniref:HTH cro/C1-type domain-containing protein n=1 Tax=candidate division WOR-1 bacterium RIFOXYB2_FULL_37_13 TaxID=1802579 RepID=A0A1F4SHI6_UNCSA|nr:MAG: hypothetical protein A2310_05840 [candidate division WOR-1 bacterium RIFOXYB2_FULL_37_13]OGC32950.1 MAG: hypothetical protein A3J90_04095 [candidate division WOR-1 bacterium RIFOXYC2_FULL_37_10]
MNIFLLPQFLGVSKPLDKVTNANPLAATRNATGCSQQRLAEIIGTTPRTISSWEIGDPQLSKMYYAALVRAYHAYLTGLEFSQEKTTRAESRSPFETVRRQLKDQVAVGDAVLGLRIVPPGDNNGPLLLTVDKASTSMPFNKPDFPINFTMPTPTAFSLEREELSALGYNGGVFFESPLDTYFSSIIPRNLLMFSPETASIPRGLLFVLLLNKLNGEFIQSDVEIANRHMVAFMKRPEIEPVLRFIAAVNVHMLNG